ncbi:hypothetical protein [Kutzneria sp. CA-103260]|uniref:hypothetical protein n=1 Tax=Kutzneria sp. CA-103260 TaxID=2802641 RepID=UPI001BAA1DA8|nr:hypothetical protein [Kutzneria sp. CA-103260]QUQ68256.1 hypothetical protein JJ691_60010 [Kutzneria sp. CA-103260]
MAHRLSLTRRAAELRRLYTAETDSTLLPTIANALNRFSPDHRAMLHEILDRGYETRLFGENTVPAVDHRFRDALLPDTTDILQQQLEAGILYALGQVAPYQWPDTDVVAPMPLCRMARPVPGSEQTILHLPLGALARMMAVLTPRVVDCRPYGLAGLRATLQRRHVQLHLADGGPTRLVGLAKVSARQWAASLAFVQQVHGFAQPPVLDGRLTGPERDVIRAGRVPGPVALACGVFRRLRILGDTFWLTVDTDGPDGLRLGWSGGRSAVQVATALVHPVTGLAGDRFYVTRVAEGAVTIIVTGIAGEPTAKLALHQVPLTATPPFTPVDVSAAWDEFRRVMKTTSLSACGLELVSR